MTNLCYPSNMVLKPLTKLITLFVYVLYRINNIVVYEFPSASGLTSNHTKNILLLKITTAFELWDLLRIERIASYHETILIE